MITAAAPASNGHMEQKTSCSGHELPSSLVTRSRAALAGVLSCELCGGVFRDPWVSTLCMHTACYKCFARHWQWDGKQNKCPLCDREGVTTVWGSFPIVGWLRDQPKLQRDYALVGILRKLFPRPDVDAEMEALDQELVQLRPEKPALPLPRTSSSRPRVIAAAPAAANAPAAAATSQGLAGELLPPGQQHQRSGLTYDEFVPVLLLRLPTAARLAAFPPAAAGGRVGVKRACAACAARHRKCNHPDPGMAAAAGTLPSSTAPAAGATPAAAAAPAVAAAAAAAGQQPAGAPPGGQAMQGPGAAAATTAAGGPAVAAPAAQGPGQVSPLAAAANAEATAAGVAELRRPYVTAPWGATVGDMASFIADLLRGEGLLPQQQQQPLLPPALGVAAELASPAGQAAGGSSAEGAQTVGGGVAATGEGSNGIASIGNLRLHCRGVTLRDHDTLLAVYHRHWAPAAAKGGGRRPPPDQLMQLHYSFAQ